MKYLFSVISILIVMSSSIASVQADENEPGEFKPRVGVLSEEVVRAQLSSAGFGTIKSIEKKDKYYVVETSRNNRPVLVRINAVTGKMSEENR